MTISLKTWYISCLLFPVIIANFNHDNPVLKILKNYYFLLWGQMSPVLDHAYVGKDFHFLLMDFLK